MTAYPWKPLGNVGHSVGRAEDKLGYLGDPEALLADVDVALGL